MQSLRFKIQWLKCKAGLLKTFYILCFTFSFLYSTAQKILWSESAPGVWKGIVGKPESYDLIKASGSKPNIPALGKITRSAFPLLKTDIGETIKDGKTYLRFPLKKEEQLYGFGLNFQTVHQR